MAEPMNRDADCNLCCPATDSTRHEDNDRVPGGPLRLLPRSDVPPEGLRGLPEGKLVTLVDPAYAYRARRAGWIFPARS